MAKDKRGKNRTYGKRVSAPFPHFRYYKKSGHPALIVGEQKTEVVRANKKELKDEYR